MNKTGIDISKKRLDDLDKQALAFAIDNNINNPSKRFADFGCGSGKISVAISCLGYEGFLNDTKSLRSRFQNLSRKLGVKLNFKQSKIEKIEYKEFPDNLDLIISQRTLHYLAHKNLITFLKQSKKSLNKGGRVFLSFSGVDSEIGKDYDLNPDLDNRFSKVSETNQEKFQILDPVCLYSIKEIEDLMEKLDFKKIKAWESDFKNIKVIYEKK